MGQLTDHMMARLHHNHHCGVQVANYLVDRLGKKCVTAELLQPDELISGMISQVAAEPEMALLLNHFIYSTSGASSYLSPPLVAVASL